MTSILTGDILALDIIVRLEQKAELMALVNTYELRRGGKIRLTQAQLEEFSAAIRGQDVTIAPGGSSANMLTTLSKLLGRRVKIRFIGAAGDNAAIRAALEEAHIELLPKMLPPAQAATSFVLLFPDGQCTIATYRGNAREVLTPELITDALVQESDIVLLQGSLWQKLEPAFAERMLALRARYRKELWFALPTQAGLDEAQGAYFREVIRSADLVLGNEDELCRLYGAERAFAQLQAELQNAGQLAFITRGSKGATIIDRERILDVPCACVAPGDIVNTLGAGDTSYAGFAAARLRGFSAQASGEAAMALAAEKIKIIAPRLPDPATLV